MSFVGEQSGESTRVIFDPDGLALAEDRVARTDVLDSCTWDAPDGVGGLMRSVERPAWASWFHS